MVAPTPARGWEVFDYRRALKASNLPPLVRLLLGTLADIPTRGGDGLAAGPNVALAALGRDTGCSRRTVMRNLDKAADAGWLERIHAANGHRLRYRLVVPATAAPAIADPGHSDPGSDANPGHSDPGTRVTVTPVPGHSDPPLSLLYLEPSIEERVREQVRTACPELTPDDDEIAALIETLETRRPHPVENVPGFLHACSAADVRRLFTLARTQRRRPAPIDVGAELAAARANPALECDHGQPGGLHIRSDTGLALCAMCRAAGQRAQSAANAAPPTAWQPPRQFARSQRLSAAGVPN